MQFPTTSGGRTAGYRIGSNQSAGIPASPDGSAPTHVVTGAAVEPHAGTVLAGDDAEAVVLDLVQPCVAGARSAGVQHPAIMKLLHAGETPETAFGDRGRNDALMA